jgi:ABC-type transporter Mla subunit MlaD
MRTTTPAAESTRLGSVVLVLLVLVLLVLGFLIMLQRLRRMLRQRAFMITMPMESVGHEYAGFTAEVEGWRGAP